MLGVCKPGTHSIPRKHPPWLGRWLLSNKPTSESVSVDYEESWEGKENMLGEHGSSPSVSLRCFPATWLLVPSSCPSWALEASLGVQGREFYAEETTHEEVLRGQWESKDAQWPCEWQLWWNFAAKDDGVQKILAASLQVGDGGWLWGGCILNVERLVGFALLALSRGIKNKDLWWGVQVEDYLRLVSS